VLKVKHAICEEASRRIRLLVGASDVGQCEINILGAELKKIRETEANRYSRAMLVSSQIWQRCFLLAKLHKYDVHLICSKINAEPIISSVLRHTRLLEEEDEDEEKESAISRPALKEK
jgi:hypothetical protein